MVRAIVDLDDVARILFLVLGYLVLGFKIVTVRAYWSVGGNSSFHHGVDLLQSKVGICIYLPEPIKLSIMDKQNEIEVALIGYLNGLLDQVFRAPVFRVRQVCCVVVTHRRLWLVCAHLTSYYRKSAPKCDQTNRYLFILLQILKEN